MATRAQVLTPWQTLQAPDGPTNQPLLLSLYAVQSLTDVTGQPAQNVPTNPNVFAVEIVVDDATFAQIAADNRFQVLWNEPG